MLSDSSKSYKALGINQIASGICCISSFGLDIISMTDDISLFGLTY
jgi:hypothetical protein